MKLFGFLNKSPSDSSSALPDIYPLSVDSALFIKSDVEATYTKILTDTLERTHGIPKDIVPLLWDNCVQNETQYGLVSLLVTAMVEQKDLFIVYKSSVKVLRKADSDEQTTIKKDYETKGTSPLGVFISFRKYRRTDMLRIYSALEYSILTSLHKTVNISKAVQIKVDSLRASVSLADSGVAEAQARSIAEALKAGKDVYLDAKDTITTSTPDVTPTEKAIGFLDAKRAFYLDLPIAYISGLQTTGLSSTGEADTKAIERGLKQYYFAIIDPVLTALFDIDTEFKSQDFRQMSSSLEALKTFELVSDTILSLQSKRDILARMFDIDPEDERAALKKEATARGSQTSLSDAQLAAMGGFLTQLSSGQLAPETAIQALMISFNMTEEDAEALVEPMIKVKPVVVKPTAGNLLS